MASIPGIVYLIIGGVVAFISSRLQGSEPKFALFFWMGIVFIVIGTFKTIFWFIANKPKTKKETSYTKPQAIERPGLEPIKKELPQKNKHPKYCPKCGLLYSQHSNFCSKCGQQLYIRP